MFYIAGISIAAWLVTHLYISVSLATCLLFSRVGQITCFRALVTRPSSFVNVLVTKRAALRWTCSSHYLICSIRIPYNTTIIQRWCH